MIVPSNVVTGSVPPRTFAAQPAPVAYQQPQVNWGEILLAAGAVWLGVQGLKALLDDGQEPRDTYKYEAFVGNRKVHGGITYDLDQREGQHRRVFGSKVRLRQVGNRTTRSGALAWERRKGY